jgi:hypothetical protein
VFIQEAILEIDGKGLCLVLVWEVGRPLGVKD